MTAIKKEEVSIVKISLFQAIGVVTYITLVSLLMFNAEKWFGADDNILAPILMLTLLSTSILICGLLVGGYAMSLYLKNREFNSPVKIIALTTLWLFIFFLITLTVILLK